MSHMLLAGDPTQRQPEVGIGQHPRNRNLIPFLTAIRPLKESEFNAAMIPLQFGRQDVDAKVEYRLVLETPRPTTAFKALPTPPMTPPPTNSKKKTPSNHLSCSVTEHCLLNNLHDSDQNTTTTLINLVKDMYSDIRVLTRKNTVLMREALSALDMSFDVKALKEENRHLTEEMGNLRTIIEDLHAPNTVERITPYCMKDHVLLIAVIQTLSKDNALLQRASNIASMLAYELVTERSKNACSGETLDVVPETLAPRAIAEVANKAVKFDLPEKSDCSKNTILNALKSSGFLQDGTKTVTGMKDVPDEYQWHLERLESPQVPTTTAQAVTPRTSLPFSKHGSIRYSLKKKFRSSTNSSASAD